MESVNFLPNLVVGDDKDGREETIMRGIFVFVIGLFLSPSLLPAQVRDIDLGVSVADGRLRGFYIALGDSYRVPPRQIVEFRDRYRCPDEELPVVYFLASRAHVEPAVIIDLRMRNRMSWSDIAFRYQLTPDIFFVTTPVERIGPPYGKAYGYYRKYGQTGDWKKIRLNDREVSDLVNLRFMSEHYGMSPESVMAMRGKEKRFVVINDDIRRGKDKGDEGKGNHGQNGKGRGKKDR